jgi:DNA primase catalytic subunit
VLIFSFAEADKVQKEIFEREKVESKGWMEKREEKIETALTTLRGKQAAELTNLRKRFKTLLDELLTERKI